MVASSAAQAVARIGRFYRVFHSAQLAENRVELLLNTPLPEPTVQELNQRFDDLILGPGDIGFLRKTFGDRLTLYPHGGHCGNLNYRVNSEDMLEFFRG